MSAGQWGAAVTGAMLCAFVAHIATPWVCELSGRASRWIRARVHVLIAALLGAGATRLATGTYDLLAFEALACACALLVVIDLVDYRLPDVIVLRLYPVVLVLLGAQAGVDGSWVALGRAVAGMAVLFAGYRVLSLVSPSGMGLGDVKLAGPLGAFLGWLGWQQLLVGSFAAFATFAVFALLALACRLVPRTAQLPFGPWMILGAALGAALAA